MASGVSGVSSNGTIENQEDGGRLVSCRDHAMTPCEEETVNSSKLPQADLKLVRESDTGGDAETDRSSAKLANLTHSTSRPKL